MKKKNTLQVLLATMNQTNDTVLDKMKIASDIIVCNQNKDFFRKREYVRDGYNVQWYDLSEKGVGLNRNNALMRASADICLIADDDVTYLDNYEATIIKAYEDNPNADVILFNIHTDSKHKRFICNKKMKINRFNCGRFGGVRITFRLSKVIKNSICFNLLFGGGTKYTAGEDVMFIRDCIRKGLKVIAVPDYILSLREERESTWFKGYDKKFFNDVGSSYVYHYGNFAHLFSMIQLFRKRNTWLKDTKFSVANKWVKEGIREYKEL